MTETEQIQKEGKRGATGRSRGGETVIMIYCIKRESIFNKGWCSIDLPSGQHGGGIFSTEVPSSKMTPVCV